MTLIDTVAFNAVCLFRLPFWRAKHRATKAVLDLVVVMAETRADRSLSFNEAVAITSQFVRWLPAHLDGFNANPVREMGLFFDYEPWEQHVSGRSPSIG